MNKKFIVFLSSRKSWTLPYIIFSAIFVIIPLFLIVVYAFTDDSGHLTLANFQKFFEHPEAINTFVYSIGIAIITTLVCILLGYPAAWILSNSKLNRSKTMVVLFILPMWVNILVRTLATVALFDFFSVPLGEGALIFGMVYNFIPFMIYPIYNTLQKMDHSYIEAAQDLGANPLQVFLKAVLPLSMPGVMSGIMMVFMPTGRTAYHCQSSSFHVAGQISSLGCRIGRSGRRSLQTGSNLPHPDRTRLLVLFDRQFCYCFH